MISRATITLFRDGSNVAHGHYVIIQTAQKPDNNNRS